MILSYAMAVNSIAVAKVVFFFDICKYFLNIYIDYTAFAEKKVKNSILEVTQNMYNVYTIHFPPSTLYLPLSTFHLTPITGTSPKNQHLHFWIVPHSSSSSL